MTMRRGAINLTPDQIEEAKRLYADGWSYARIGERVGCYYEVIKRLIDANHAVNRRIQNREARQRRYHPGKRAPKTGRENATSVDIKEDAAARLAEIPKDDRSLTARLMGDPLPTRSALDKRQQA